MKRSPISKISKKQRRKLKNLAEIRKSWWEFHQPLTCGICKEPIGHFYELDSDHITPGKMGGCRVDDPRNLQPAHKICNIRKGSSRPKYKPEYVKPQEIQQP